MPGRVITLVLTSTPRSSEKEWDEKR